jgi:hypothetical protein
LWRVGEAHKALESLPRICALSAVARAPKEWFGSAEIEADFELVVTLASWLSATRDTQPPSPGILQTTARYMSAVFSKLDNHCKTAWGEYEDAWDFSSGNLQ